MTILEAGRATLELLDPVHSAFVDEVEVGRRVAGHIRLAFEVDDSEATTRALEGAGATVHRRADIDALELDERPLGRPGRAPAHALHRAGRLTRQRMRSSLCAPNQALCLVMRSRAVASRGSP